MACNISSERSLGGHFKIVIKIVKYLFGGNKDEFLLLFDLR